ncbi:MAG: diguanylate cyclase [Ruminococcus sp.]|nr:diguanylate cyclase [Ruminococcus sp.]
MSNLQKKMKTGKINFIMALVLLLATIIVMGVVLMTMSKNALREQVEGRMLDVSNSAAAQLNGDELKTISLLERESEEYQRAYNILHKYNDNIKLEYIYALVPYGDGNFTFAIDPDDEEPAEYGELIEMTAALKKAANGVPSVDKVPHNDEWGRFYSAYSPFYDSQGELVGIVGVDFDADDYDDTLNSYREVAVIIAVIAMMIGIVLSFVIMSKNRRNFAEMLSKINDLETEIQHLDNSLVNTSIKKLALLPANGNEALKTLAAGEMKKISVRNEYDEVNTSLENVYEKLKKYISYVDRTAYTDEITGVLNKAAYREKINELDDSIKNGNAAFAIGFFDINGIKKIYTRFGFEAGEEIMFECAKLLNNVFGASNVYHITGDEFIAIMDGKGLIDMDNYVARLDKEISVYNSGQNGEYKLSVARGCAVFDPSKHEDYRHVFIDVKANADRNKEFYYTKHDK